MGVVNNNHVGWPVRVGDRPKKKDELLRTPVHLTSCRQAEFRVDFC